MSKCPLSTLKKDEGNITQGHVVTKLSPVAGEYAALAGHVLQLCPALAAKPQRSPHTQPQRGAAHQAAELLPNNVVMSGLDLSSGREISQFLGKT